MNARCLKEILSKIPDEELDEIDVEVYGEVQSFAVESAEVRFGTLVLEVCED